MGCRISIGWARKPSSSSFFWTSGVLVAGKELLKAASKWRAWGQEKLLLLGDEMQAARGQRPNSHDFRKMVG